MLDPRNKEDKHLEAAKLALGAWLSDEDLRSWFWCIDDDEKGERYSVTLFDGVPLSKEALTIVGEHKLFSKAIRVALSNMIKALIEENLK